MKLKTIDWQIVKITHILNQILLKKYKILWSEILFII